MKFVMIVSLLLLTSFNNVKSEELEVSRKKEIPTLGFSEYQFKNHRYLLVRHCREACVIHDLNCPCQKKENGVLNNAN